VVDATLASTTVSQNQDVTITVTATTPNGCSASDQVVIDVYSEITELGNNIDACAGDVVELNSGWPANYTINWSTGEHTSAIELVTSEEITVEVISPNGCFSSDNVSVVFHDYPIVELGPDIEVCQGELVTLDAGNPTLNVEWRPLFQAANVVYANSTGMYTAIVDNGFCESRDSIFLNVHPLPLKPFGRDSLVCFEDLGGGACVDSFAIALTESCAGELYVPSAFTPDGDGMNEVWLVTGSDVLEYHLIIYDRWGVLVYESHSLKLPWLGQLRDGDEYVEAGVYPYIIEYKVKSSTGKISDAKKYKGFVTLIR
jgi:gliding motility-associated-like protein